jgi:type IV secretion system protein VirB4
MSANSRRFLVRQGHQSVVAELDLRGFDDELAVLSGRTASIELLAAIRKEVGDRPDDWLPLFFERRLAA